jgi:alpha-tubulin suppressor-like RCC1 family protein
MSGIVPGRVAIDLGRARRLILGCASIALVLPWPALAAGAGVQVAPSISSARWDTLMLATDGSVYGCGAEGDYVKDPDFLGYPVLQFPAGAAQWVSAGRYDGYVNSTDLGGVGFIVDKPGSVRPVAGYSATFYIGRKGRVYSAGQNFFGQLGDPSIPFASPPSEDAAVNYPAYTTVKRKDGSPLEGIVSVAAGSSFVAAVDVEGDVWTWGHNGYGELGDGTLNDRGYAARVSGLEDVVAVAASTGRYLDAPWIDGILLVGSQLHDHVLALTRDGTVWGWGENRDGELGNGTKGIQVTNPFTVRSPTSRPVQVLTGPRRPLTNVIAIAVGGAHSIALRSDGTVWTWGYNGTGQLGDNSAFEGVKVFNGLPVNSFARQVAGLSRIKGIAAGPAESFAIDADGDVYSWGFNGNRNLCAGVVTATLLIPSRVTNADGPAFSLGAFPSTGGR